MVGYNFTHRVRVKSKVRIGNTVRVRLSLKKRLG